MPTWLLLVRRAPSFRRRANTLTSMGFHLTLSADIAEAWNEIGSTTAGGSKGVTADMLSKIWTIPHEMAVKTIVLTSQLNREGKNTYLARNLETN